MKFVSNSWVALGVFVLVWIAAFGIAILVSNHSESGNDGLGMFLLLIGVVGFIYFLVRAVRSSIGV